MTLNVFPLSLGKFGCLFQTRPQKDPVYYDPNKTAAHDFPESEMQPRMSSSGGMGGGGGGGSRNSGGRHYGGSYGGSGDAGGFRDNQGGRNRNSGGPPNGGLMSRGAAGGRSMQPQMEMMDNAGNMGAPGAFGSFNEYGAPPQMGGGAPPHGFPAYGGAPHAFRHAGGPEFGMEAASDATRTMKVSIKNEDAGAVIGPKGATINRVRERSGCSIKIDDGRGPDSLRGMRIITITGTDQQIQFAQYLMQQR